MCRKRPWSGRSFVVALVDTSGTWSWYGFWCTTGTATALHAESKSDAALATTSVRIPIASDFCGRAQLDHSEITSSPAHAI